MIASVIMLMLAGNMYYSGNNNQYAIFSIVILNAYSTGNKKKKYSQSAGRHDQWGHSSHECHGLTGHGLLSKRWRHRRCRRRRILYLLTSHRLVFYARRLAGITVLTAFMSLKMEELPIKWKKKKNSYIFLHIERL